MTNLLVGQCGLAALGRLIPGSLSTYVMFQTRWATGDGTIPYTWAVS